MPRQPPTFLTLPLELRLEIYTHLLVLPPPPPVETQQTTYRCAYSSSPPSPASPNSAPQKKSPTKPTLHPAILRVNSQTNTEATPILYAHNTFSAHPIHLTAHPTLYHPYHTFRPLLAEPPKHHHRPGQDQDHQQNHHQDQQQQQDPSQPSPPPVITHPRAHLIKNWHLRLKLDSPLPPYPTPLLASSFSNSHSLTLDLWRSPSGYLFGGVGAEQLRGFEAVCGVRKVRVKGVVGGWEGYVRWLVTQMRRGDGDMREEYVPGDEAEARRLRGWV